MGMNPYRIDLKSYLGKGFVTERSVLYRVAAGWLASLAVVMAAGLLQPASTGTLVVGLLTIIVSAVAAVAFYQLARRRDEAILGLEQGSQILQFPSSPNRMDKSA
jgi:hypothetical protein